MISFMISLTCLPSLSDPPPVNPPATIASSRTWASAFAASKEPEGTLCFSAPLAEKLQIAATGTRTMAKDGTVVHVLRLLPCPREELEEWERLMRGARRREVERREKEEKERREKEEKERREKEKIQELEAKGQTVAEGARVMARIPGWSKAYPGTVRQYNEGKGTYIIDFDDGDVEKNVDHEDVEVMSKEKEEELELGE